MPFVPLNKILSKNSRDSIVCLRRIQVRRVKTKKRGPLIFSGDINHIILACYINYIKEIE